MGLTRADRLALGLFASCALSIMLRPPADPKQIALLALSLAAYPAVRGLAGIMHTRAFMMTLGAIVAVGTIAMALALAAEGDPQGKPEIFGFDHGAVQIAMLLATLSFALVCSRMHLAVVAAATAAPLAILAAAQVRFALVAMVACLTFGAVVAPRPFRLRLFVIAGVAAIAVLCGMLARRTMTAEYVRYAEESFNLKAAPQGQTAPFQVPGELALRIPAPRCPEVNLNNSIEMRKRLYTEAFALLPSAGLTGIGLGRFQEISCVNAEVHNSILQAAIELGIPSAVLLAALIVVVARSLWPLARKRGAALLALLTLTYAVLMSFASGRITADIFLFLMIGYAAGTSASNLARATWRLGALLRPNA